MDTLSYLLKQIGDSIVQLAPFPYFHNKQVFPEDYYQEMIENIPDIRYFSPMDGYSNRFCFSFRENLKHLPFNQQIFWYRFKETLRNQKLADLLLEKFQCFSEKPLRIDTTLIRDQSDYAIGPHTDHPNKILTLLFYLPLTESQSHLGTSLYIPKDRSFRCKGSGHYDFKGFDRIYTAPFVPNSVFGFLKSDISFHGVEPIGKQEKERILITYTIWEQISQASLL